MITALQPSGGNPICGRRESLPMRIDKCQSCSTQTRSGEGWTRRLSSAASTDEDTKKFDMDLSWRKTVAQKSRANGSPSSESKNIVFRRNSSLPSDAIRSRRCAGKSQQNDCLKNGSKEVNCFAETPSNIPKLKLTQDRDQERDEEMMNGSPVRRVGSLTSSPKWARIKRTFERQNSDESSERSDAISKTFSKSSNTLAIPRYPSDKDLGSENGPLMKSKSMPSCGVLQLHYAQNVSTSFTRETILKPSNDRKCAANANASFVKPSSLVARSQSFKQNPSVNPEISLVKNETNNERSIVSAKREASALYKNKSGSSLEQLHNCSFRNKIALGAEMDVTGVEKTRRLYLQSECAAVLKTASSSLLKSNVGLQESRISTNNTNIPVGRRFLSSREIGIKNSPQKFANGISQVRVDECLQGSKNAWKLTPSGTWVRSNDVPEARVMEPHSKTSKVALLAQKFDHLSNSVSVDDQESLSETENTSKISFRKAKIKSHALNNGDAPLPLKAKLPDSNQNLGKTCLNGQLKEEKGKCLDASEDDALQNNKNRKYSLVQQVVQNFEGHCQLNISADHELVFQYQKESRTSQESWCTVQSKIPHEKEKYAIDKFRQTTESVQKLLDKSISGTNRSCLNMQQKRATPSGRKAPPVPASVLAKRRQGILSDGGEEPANNVVGDDLLSSMEDWLEQKCLRANDGSPSVKPNPSFLWHRLGPRLSSESAENESQGGYYSVPFQHLQKFQQEEHIYMDATLLRKSPASQRKSSSNSSSIHLNDTQGSSCSSDEGWVDMSDAETDQVDSNRISKVVGVHLRPRSRSSKSDTYRRSWSRSLRDLASAVDTDTEEWEANEYQDISVWESGDTSSSSTNSDHIYETLYDVIVEDRERDIEENDRYDIVENGDRPNLKMMSSISVDTGIDSARTPSSNSTEDAGEDKSENEKSEGLKRNWSLTKSDIRLELSSKLNKIKSKKNYRSTTDIGVGSTQVRQQNPTLPAPESKKKTLIKFILRQKSSPAPAVQKKRNNHKKGATFYVRWSVVDKSTRERSQSESALVEATQLESPPVLRRTSEGGPGIHPRDESVKPRATVQRRPSGAGAIKRPTSPPPLPPVPAHTTRTRTGTKSLELLPSKCVVSRTDSNKSRSLDVDRAVKFDFGDGKRESRKGDSLGAYFPNCGNESHINLNTPQSRISVASKSSFAGSYIHEDEVASIPKPTSLLLSAEREEEDESSYLQLREHEDLQETLKSPFEEEPLYQFYQRHVSQRATRWRTMNDADAESDVGETATQDDHEEGDYCVPEKLHPTAMDLLHHSRAGLRTLWCEVPEVIKSGILDEITLQEKKLQEAMFEVITSEASYLKSLNVLVEHFMKRPEFGDDFSCNCVLERRERHVLFSDVLPVRDVSMRVLADLEKRWQENILLSNICDILHEHATKFFSVYVRYCSNQVYQERKLKELKTSRPDFVDVLQRLESNPICQGLDMHSFLMLPMQRITRMPLLVDAIFHRLPADSPHYDICKLTLAQLNKVVWECNEGARKMERMEEMLVISRQLDFKDSKSIALISASRWLVKRGELTRIAFDVFTKRTFGRSTRCSKNSVYLFLFTDLLLIAKKKSEDSYTVLDYCPRNMVQVFTIEDSGLPLPVKLPENYKNLLQLTMLQNHEGKTVEMILSCPLESDRTRWMEAVTPPKSENPEEKIYEQWDCPQVQCIYSYAAQQPDELSLDESDVVNVFRKMSDGWYEGERLRDGVRGWFPASFTVEIISSHIRARNLRQRYRLLVLSHAYLEEQRKACQSQCSKGK